MGFPYDSGVGLSPRWTRLARWGAHLGTGAALIVLASTLYAAVVQVVPGPPEITPFYHAVEVALGILASAGGARLLIPMAFRLWSDSRRNARVQASNSFGSSFDGTERRSEARAEGDFAGYVRERLGTLTELMRDGSRDREALTGMVRKSLDNQATLLKLLDQLEERSRGQEVAIRAATGVAGTLVGVEAAISKVGSELAQFAIAWHSMQLNLESTAQGVDDLLRAIRDDGHEPRSRPKRKRGRR